MVPDLVRTLPTEPTSSRFREILPTTFIHNICQRGRNLCNVARTKIYLSGICTSVINQRFLHVSQIENVIHKFLNVFYHCFQLSYFLA